MIFKADKLLENAIDMHCHGYPEWSLENEPRMDDADMILHARNMGMRGVVLKSHSWPTMYRAQYLQKLVPGFQIFSSITLNPCCGGINPWVVEMAVKEGAKVVWMPTWGVPFIKDEKSMVEMVKKWVPSMSGFSKDDCIPVLDGNGHLLPKVQDVLRLIKDLDITLSTGHLGPRESLAVIEKCNSLGVKKVIFCHPIGINDEFIRMGAEAGAFIELCCLGTMPIMQHFHPRRLFETMRMVGAEHCILTTDTVSNWSPPFAEGLRMHITTMLQLGSTDEEISLMIRQNPAKLLGLD
jgi:hypothetical protein